MTQTPTKNTTPTPHKLTLAYTDQTNRTRNTTNPTNKTPEKPPTRSPPLPTTSQSRKALQNLHPHTPPCTHPRATNNTPSPSSPPPPATPGPIRQPIITLLNLEGAATSPTAKA
ncbi:hypothetical protein CesoFtcFv8_014445 [Champsocephalus esox]|uniref:Uncharacterized protein n=1 Tax=Champsocephalus esox TaxID=159716 RepID=A0AAN8BNT3_9TELE|nr:hypothetical protein CesoFtcFv8_014445 [Champsocephalus esox]